MAEMARDLFAVVGLLSVLVGIGRALLFRKRSITMAGRKR